LSGATVDLLAVLPLQRVAILEIAGAIQDFHMEG
jgi:hypothetical protein